MSDGPDLRVALKDWPYDPDNDARIIRGADGREVLQVRLPLGLEQYEMEGRPDGFRPDGFESVLERHMQRLEVARQAGEEAGFEISEAECAELFNEGTLYYLRYVRLFQLRDWERTARDTSRNLNLFDFVHRYAEREEDQLFLEKWRPYIIRVNASARAMIEVEKREFAQGAEIIHDAIAEINMQEEMDDETFRVERNRSLDALRQLAERIEKSRPVSKLESLERKLKRAIEKQEFERAAQLRDEINEMRNGKAS